MEEVLNEWLPHLNNAIPGRAYGNNLSMYSIALEGWRRGLPLKFFTAYKGEKFEIQYSLSYQKTERKFEISKGDLVSEEAKIICDNKTLTKKYLSELSIPVPKGKSFSYETKNEDIIEHAMTLGFPIVLKPTNGKLGKGVILNINNVDELREALIYVRGTLLYKEVIIEQYIHGDDYRIYVVGKEVIGAVHRIPANVVGNGVNKVNELIEMKNKQRKNNPNLSTRPIKVDKEVLSNIEKEGYSLESILKDGERLFLRSIGNISSGGEPVDITDELSDQVKDIAVKCIEAIPGLSHGGIDIIVDRENSIFSVLEVNTRSGIGSHLYPVKGKARDIPKAIVDFYFPQTKEKGNENSPYLFDFKHITDVLRSGASNEILVTPCPVGKHLSDILEVYGDVRTTQFKQWIQKQALYYNINGYLKNLKNGNVLIVISGEEKNIDKLKKIIRKHCPIKYNVASRVPDDYLNVGFEIKHTNRTRKPLDRKLKNINTSTKKNEEKDKLIKQLAKEEKRLSKIQNSKTWRYTTFIRKLTKKIKS